MTIRFFRNKTILRALLLLLFFVFCEGFADINNTIPDTTSPAALPPTLTLTEAVMLALRYNPDVKSAKLQRIVDKFNLRVAQWAYEVQYSLTANYNYNDNVTNGVDSPQNQILATPGAKWVSPIGTTVQVGASNALNQNVSHAMYYNPTMTFNITQPLLKNFGRDITLEPLHAAQNSELAAQLNFKNQVMQTITTVVTQYAAVVNAINMLKTNQLSLQTSVDTLKQQQELVKAGRAAPADLVQFQSNVASGQLALEQSQVALTQAKQTLLVTLGIDPCLPINVAPTVDYPTETIPCLNDSIHLALQNNIDYQKEFIALKNLELNYLVDKNAARWELDANVTRTQGQGIAGNPASPTLLNNFNVANTAGLALTVPIDDVAAKTKIQSDKIGLEQEHIHLAADKEAIISGISSDYYTVINQKQQITQAQQAVDLAKKNLQIAQAKYQYGRSTAFELSSLQAAVTTAQINYNNAMNAYINSLATFDQTLGITLCRWNLQLRY